MMSQNHEQMIELFTITGIIAGWIGLVLSLFKKPSTQFLGESLLLGSVCGILATYSLYLSVVVLTLHGLAQIQQVRVLGYLGAAPIKRSWISWIRAWGLSFAFLGVGFFSAVLGSVSSFQNIIEPKGSIPTELQYTDWVQFFSHEGLPYLVGIGLLTATLLLGTLAEKYIEMDKPL
jgi:hypothetical protein